MGATFRTFAVRRGKSSDVRTLIVSWLRAKGFELTETQGLFPFDPETERGIVLSESQDWTVVAFSHSFEEGDRLVFEFTKLQEPLLEMWVYDSDIWGYRLHNARRLVASFNSKPRYFGGPPELELPQNGDPELLCELCELGTAPARLAAIERRRAVFAESVAERFCAELGAEPAALDYNDFEEASIEPGQTVTAGGFRIERLLFARSNGAAARSGPRLHDLVLRSSPAPQVDPAIAELQGRIEHRMRPLLIAVRVLGALFRAVGWILGPLFLLWWRRRGARHVLPKCELLRELLPGEAAPPVERRAGRAFNRRHRCSIALPDHAELHSLPMPGAVFWFQLGPVSVHCEVIRPSQLRDKLKLWPATEVVEDEKGFVAGLPSRIVFLQSRPAGRNIDVAWCLVETNEAVYRFLASGEELSAELRQQLRDILVSFRVESAEN
jgi:hypothetical protein